LPGYRRSGKVPPGGRFLMSKKIAKRT
jgi:hypothetical protein